MVRAILGDALVREYAEQLEAPPVILLAICMSMQVMVKKFSDKCAHADMSMGCTSFCHQVLLQQRCTIKYACGVLSMCVLPALQLRPAVFVMILATEPDAKPYLRMQSLLLPSACPVDDPSKDQSG